MIRVFLLALALCACAHSGPNGLPDNGCPLAQTAPDAPVERFDDGTDGGTTK